MIKSVIVHSCNCRTADTPSSLLVPNVNYLTVGDGWYRPLPPKCKCRKKITYSDADDYVHAGKALVVSRFKEGRLVETIDRGAYGGVPMVWMPQERTKTPRVDLPGKADIERAFIDKLDKYIELIDLNHEFALESRRLMFYGIVLEKGEYKSGSPMSVADPFEGRVLFIDFNQQPSASTGRTVSEKEWTTIEERLDAGVDR